MAVHTLQKAEPPRPRSTLPACCAQPLDFQPSCESLNWVATTGVAAAADTVPAADLAGSIPQVVAGMASSSFRVQHMSAAAAAAAAVANTVKEQTDQGLSLEGLAGAS